MATYSEASVTQILPSLGNLAEVQRSGIYPTFYPYLLCFFTIIYPSVGK